MALVKENYESKSTGLILPKAYALLKYLCIHEDNSATAVFSVQTNRENAIKYNALDEVEVYFKWDRNTDPAVSAYHAAKNDSKVVKNYETGEEVTEYGTLYGWEDDIV